MSPDIFAEGYHTPNVRLVLGCLKTLTLDLCLESPASRSGLGRVKLGRVPACTARPLYPSRADVARPRGIFESRFREQLQVY
jgi:hypothetical protein